MQTPLLKQKERDTIKDNKEDSHPDLERIVGAKIHFETEKLKSFEKLYLLKDGLVLIAILA